MADEEQMKKIIPFVTCGITFGQNVCELMSGINVSNLNVRIKINPVKQPVQSNSVGSWYMSHCGISAFYYHFFTASLSSKTHNIALEPECVTLDGTWSILVRSRWVCMVGICFRMFGWLFADKFHRDSLTSWVLLVWFGTEWHTSITISHRSRAGIPSMRKPASREMISASVELCENWSLFLAHPTCWH